MLEPMAKHLQGRAIIAVCDLSKNPDIGQRQNASAGTTIIYRGGKEVARSDDWANPNFEKEMQELGLSFRRTL
jgi:hypothetical protein